MHQFRAFPWRFSATAATDTRSRLAPKDCRIQDALARLENRTGLIPWFEGSSGSTRCCCPLDSEQKQGTQSAQAAESQNNSALPSGWNAAAEYALMKRIYDSFQKLIHLLFEGTNIADSFVAALIANESGGDPRAERLEPSVLAHLEAVKSGEIPHFGSITKKDLAGKTDVEIKELATSYGLTQIMGYHMGVHCRAEILLNPAWNLREAFALLRDFRNHFEIRDSDPEQLFRCWNTGRPDGVTADPQYVAKGLARMAIYEEILRCAQNDKAGAANDGFVVSDPEICM